MPHCIIAIFSDYNGSWAKHTTWGTEFGAYEELKGILEAQPESYPDWLGWSYWDNHKHNGELIKEKLEKDLAKDIEKVFTDTVTNRSEYRGVNLTAYTFKVKIWPTYTGESQHGFIYARITRY